jgi:hypothetical protein
MFLLANVNYFSQEGIPYLLVILFQIWILQPFSTLFHELGHAFIAMILTKSKVVVRVGESNATSLLLSFRLLDRFFLGFSPRNVRSGYTVFKTQGRFLHSLILLGGPLITLIADTLSLGEELFFVSWFCVNLLTFLRAVIPISLKPTKSFPSGVPSDGLQIIRIWFGG